MYPMALMMIGLWCSGLLRFESKFLGLMVGCFIVFLSFCKLLVWLVMFVVRGPLVA
jgi:hypothetical protein